MTNKEFADKVHAILSKGGVAVQDVTKLGSFIHLTLRCRENAERAARIMQAATFTLDKIFDSVEYVKGTEDTGSPKTYPVVRAVFRV